MKLFRFSVPGPPRGKGRPRSFAKLTKSGRVFQGNYTPDETRNNEAFVKSRFLAVNPGVRPLDEPVFMRIRAYFAPPASTPKKKVAAMIAGQLCPTKKPDIDNIVKLYLDALNGLAYRDDSLVVELHCSKHYGAVAETRVDILAVGEF